VTRARFQRLIGLVPHAPSLLRDAVRAAVVLREVEAARWTEGPEPLTRCLRARGEREKPRTADGRRRLESVVGRLDAFMRGGPNCYRRSLALLALDPDAARAPLVLGLDVQPSGASGHAWVTGTAERPKGYDVEFRV
jgi:Transglutaminase-like superfamily